MEAPTNWSQSFNHLLGTMLLIQNNTTKNKEREQFIIIHTTQKWNHQNKLTFLQEIDPKALTTPRDTCLEQWGEKFAWKKLIEEENRKYGEGTRSKQKGKWRGL